MRWRVICGAGISRILATTLIILSNRILFPGLLLHATSKIVLRDTWDAQQGRQQSCQGALKYLEGFVSWDGEYFLTSAIASPAYTYEHTHAFFPFYPFVVKSLSNLVFKVPKIGKILDKSGPCGIKAITILMGIILANVCTVITALGIYEMSLDILNFGLKYSAKCTNIDKACQVEGRAEDADSGTKQAQHQVEKVAMAKSENAKGIGKKGKQFHKSDKSAKLKLIKETSLLASLLFSFNSSGVFLSAMYTESLFGALSVWGLVLLWRSDAANAHISFGRRSLYLLTAVFLFAIATSTRSNGSLLLFFLFFRTVRNCPILGLFSPNSIQTNAYTDPSPLHSFGKLCLFVLHWLLALVLAIAVVSPIFAVLGHAFSVFCVHHPKSIPLSSDIHNNIFIVFTNYFQNATTFLKASFHNLLAPNANHPFQTSHSRMQFFPPSIYLENFRGLSASTSSWCWAALPSVYGYIQTKVWNVGFLHYWRLQKLDRFLIAAPHILVSFCALCALVEHILSPLTYAKQSSKSIHLLAKQVLHHPLTPHTIHFAILFVIFVFFANVEVISRILTASPLYFIFTATLFLQNPHFVKEFKVGEMSTSSQFSGLYIFVSSPKVVTAIVCCQCFCFFCGCFLFPKFVTWT